MSAFCDILFHDPEEEICFLRSDRRRAQVEREEIASALAEISLNLLGRGSEGASRSKSCKRADCTDVMGMLGEVSQLLESHRGDHDTAIAALRAALCCETQKCEVHQQEARRALDAVKSSENEISTLQALLTSEREQSMRLAATQAEAIAQAEVMPPPPTLPPLTS